MHRLGMLENLAVDTAVAYYYHEDGRIQTVEPIVDVAKTFANGDALDVNFTFDSLSGSSPNGTRYTEPFLINFGGDLRANQAPPGGTWKIGIQRPDTIREAHGVGSERRYHTRLGSQSVSRLTVLPPANRTPTLPRRAHCAGATWSRR